MKRCAYPACSRLVNVHKSYVNIGERVFCGHECANSWLVQSRVFEVVADPHHEVKRKPVSIVGWRARDAEQYDEPKPPPK